MKTYSSAITAYLASGKAWSQIDYVSFRVRDTDSPATTRWFHFSSDEDDEAIEVVPDDGIAVTRTFLGGGRLVSMEDLIRSEGAVDRSHVLFLSGTDNDVLDMIYGYNCRQAHYEYFVGIVDQDSGQLVDAPVLEYVGVMDAPELTDGALAVDGAEAAESLFMVKANSLGSLLQTQNFTMRSADASKQRSNDIIFRDTDKAHHRKVRWGKESRSQSDRRGDGGGTKGSTSNPWDKW